MPKEMNPDEKFAYDWSLRQLYNSVSARYARYLAGYIYRTEDAPSEMSSDEKIAYEWAIATKVDSVATRHARTLANYINARHA